MLIQELLTQIATRKLPHIVYDACLNIEILHFESMIISLREFKINGTTK